MDIKIMWKNVEKKILENKDVLIPIGTAVMGGIIGGAITKAVLNAQPILDDTLAQSEFPFVKDNTIE